MYKHNFSRYNQKSKQYQNFFVLSCIWSINLSHNIVICQNYAKLICQNYGIACNSWIWRLINFYYKMEMHFRCLSSLYDLYNLCKTININNFQSKNIYLNGNVFSIITVHRLYCNRIFLCILVYQRKMICTQYSSVSILHWISNIYSVAVCLK